MCFGVRDALQLAQHVPRPERVTIFGELVHNPLVQSQLAEAGFRQAAESDRDAMPVTPVVMITAHGISDAERQRLVAAGKQLIDTTCPLVRRVHQAAQALEAEGRHVLLIGKAGHVEVQGIVADLSSYAVVERVQDVCGYATGRLGIVCQTTMPPDVVAEIRARIERLNPDADIRFLDTVCDPTRRRQRAMLELLDQVDAVVVVGGRNSNNTLRLVQLCQQRQVLAHHVESPAQLNPAWFDGVETVGLTAGTSTLDETIDAVQAALEQIAKKKRG